ncbi:hypothetical protein [Flavobacterium piscinae]|uniref:hypothetical protein n=1 Tax=Flavobacterium piscinae TaxID=2506424 RepID=UPI002AABC817|nr:hypothetical protein [Flavobacterium piscinae]
MEILSNQELHNVAMNYVGKELEKQGFEFIAVNSQLKRHPQFVCVDKPTNTLHFVLVTVYNYPDNPEDYDVLWMETFKNMHKNLKQKCFMPELELQMQLIMKSQFLKMKTILLILMESKKFLSLCVFMFFFFFLSN